MRIIKKFLTISTVLILPFIFVTNSGAACKDEGYACSAGECCSPYTCVNNTCQGSCRAPGESCGGGLSCCSGSCDDGVCSCPEGSVCISNPIHSSSFEDLLDNVINFIFWIGMALAPIMVIIAGFNFITAAGNPAKVATARNILIWTAVGVLIILMAKGLTAVITQLIGG
jgi:hypothetical protein